MDLSGVIVNWNSGSRLLPLLSSLESLRPELVEVTVVDNGSKDGSFRHAETFPWVRLILLEENQGFAGAANRGIARSSAGWILLLNPDVQVEAQSIRELYEAAQNCPECAIVCGRLVGPEGGSQEAFQIRRLPTLAAVASDLLFLDELAERAGLSRRADLDATRVHEVEQPAAACWLLRKAAWEAIEGFDEGFFPAWFEDVDFCKRLREESSWKILYLPRWTILHEGGSTVPKVGYPRFLRIYHRNLLRYWKKHHGATYLPVWLLVKAGLALRLAAARWRS